MIRKGKSGFTLLELLVVVIILGIIMSFAIPALTGFLDRAREGEGFDLTKKGLMASYLKFNDGGLWPVNTASLTAACSSTRTSSYPWLAFPSSV